MDGRRRLLVQAGSWAAALSCPLPSAASTVQRVTLAVPGPGNLLTLPLPLASRIGADQAEGLAFSVPAGVAMPPSLRNVIAEWRRDLRQPIPPGGHLGAWARAGVLLLNTVLTVEDSAPASHTDGVSERPNWTATSNAAVARRSCGGSPATPTSWTGPWSAAPDERWTGSRARPRATASSSTASARGRPTRR